MSIDLVLKSSCGACGSAEELYGSTCKHLTLCVSCGVSLAEKRSNCDECGAPITRLIREYNVRTESCNHKNYFIARFSSGLPTFKEDGNKWSMQKEGLPGRKVTDALRERFKNRPWLLEDETGQFQYHGRLEGIQAATYYILMRRRKELVAVPADSWYNFNKVPKYKQLTLEEAEEKMKRMSVKFDGSKRWMMKAKRTGDGDEANLSDDEEETARKGRLGLNKSSTDDDDEEGALGGDLDSDDDIIEKGDDWEHDEVFSDDDETLNVYPNELEDLASDLEIEQDDEDEDDNEDEAHEEEGAGGLSKSGQEMKKLLRQANRRMKGYDAKNDNDTKEALKEEPVDSSIPLKATTSTASRRTPSSSKSSKGKRKGSREESKTPTGEAPLKKVKILNCKATCIIKKHPSIIIGGANY